MVEKMWREREVKVKNGGKENTEERRFRSLGARPSLSSAPCLFPPPLLCHSGLYCFILIRLIPPRGKLLITSTPPAPPHESNLLSALETGWGFCSAWQERKMWKLTPKRGLDSTCGWARWDLGLRGLINLQVAHLSFHSPTSLKHHADMINFVLSRGSGATPLVFRRVLSPACCQRNALQLSTGKLSVLLLQRFPDDDFQLGFKRKTPLIEGEKALFFLLDTAEMEVTNYMYLFVFVLSKYYFKSVIIVLLKHIF